MQTNRQNALARIFASEQGFAIRPTEPGGAVSDGITMLVYEEYFANHKLGKPTIDELKNITDEQKVAIYNEIVFTPMRFDEMPSGVDYAVVDYGVNFGVAGALNAIRGLFGVVKPVRFWIMDDTLLAALRATYASLVVSAICDLRWARMQASPDFTKPSIVPGKVIGDGRAFRMSAVHRGAMEMLGFAPETDRYVRPVFSSST